MPKQTKNLPRLSKAEMRVIVAKDALAQLRHERYVATSGTYIGSELLQRIGGPEEDDFGDTCYRNWDSPLQALLLKDKGECDVCAKGALFLSAVRKFNSATVGDMINDDNFKIAEKIFGIKQFDLIEAAFEGWTCTKMRNGSEGNPVPDWVLEYEDIFPDPHDRLVAILKNIVKNNGTFKL